MLVPKRLMPGDRVRFVSPASTPDRERVLQQARVLEYWGLKVDFGEHAFSRFHYLAGTDDQRLGDLNTAFRDPDVRAIVATRGGKGSYRIADRLDFDAVRRDPKFLIGFSDITILHLKLWRECGLVGLHGALTFDASGEIADATSEALRQALMSRQTISIQSDPGESTSALTNSGVASGPLIGGNLDMISVGAGWALPKLDGAILLLEAVDRYVGEVDRQLTMLLKAGHLDGVSAFAIGQFTQFKPSKSLTVVDLLRDHLGAFGVPILGGLPLGHGSGPLTVPIGLTAKLDANDRRLTIAMPPD